MAWRADPPAVRMPAAQSRGRALSGFSLIEMLVALAVFALAVLGLLNLAGESTRTAVAIEERVLAAAVADTIGVDAATLDVRTLAADAAGREHAGGRDWQWTRSTTPTADPSLLRVDIRVSPADGSHVAAEVALFRSLSR